MDFQSKFDKGLSYTDFLNEHGTEEQQRRFGMVYDSIELTESQRRVTESMTRKVYLLCMAGAWCGDCVEQCPILQRLCETAPSLELRFIDRDSDDELSSHLRICGAARVPQVVFLNEDFEYLGQMGDRTLAKYRRMAEQLKGAACPTGLGADAALTQEVTQQWLDELERIHWIVRLSPKLRERHGD